MRCMTRQALRDLLVAGMGPGTGNETAQGPPRRMGQRAEGGAVLATAGGGGGWRKKGGGEECSWRSIRVGPGWRGAVGVGTITHVSRSGRSRQKASGHEGDDPEKGGERSGSVRNRRPTLCHAGIVYRNRHPSPEWGIRGRLGALARSPNTDVSRQARHLYRSHKAVDRVGAGGGQSTTGTTNTECGVPGREC